MEPIKQTAPGLKWRKRKSGPPVPYWIAPARAVDAGYPIKSANLAHFANEPKMLFARCAQLQAEATEWVGGDHGGLRPFDGTFRSLFNHYQVDPNSSFHKLKPASRRPYLIYLPKLIAHIGHLRLAECDGRDVMRWHRTWSRDGAAPAAATTTLAILKAATAFGIMCRFPGAVDFKAVLSETRFPKLPRRTASPTAEDVVALRKAAHANGAPSRALAYALQFETTLRQWDVWGQWLPIDDPRPSAVLFRDRKWIGPTWAQIDDQLVFRTVPTKTELTTKLGVAFDLTLCPMVVEELAHWPAERRAGPLIVCEKTRMPYVEIVKVWRKDAKLAGIDPSQIWNRDLRAGGITEGGLAGATLDDRAKVAGHKGAATTALVYDRDVLEAHRRAARARIERRRS